MDLVALARRPLAEQCAALDALIERGLPDGVLLMLAGWPDPAPLAHALARLVSGLSGQAGLPVELADALVTASDAHLGRILRGQPADGMAATLRGALIERIADAAGRLPPGRVAAACFLLRWIDRADPERGQRLRAAAVDAAAQAVSRGDDIQPHVFLRLPGHAYADLEARARAKGRTAAWRRALDTQAAAMLLALEAQPKSLSQVGAEGLLSRKVYTDAAHFLMELIQNAEDADAGRWALTVGPDRLVVEHDGVPFDARDVVGVLSIGQTTKSGARIGFFGVGFKSVYAVSDRPRVTSGPFDFEIADVSVPRLIEGRPAASATRLELPLRAPGDERSGSQAIGRRAAALPETLLLTLRHIHRLEITVGGVTRIVSRRRLDDGSVEIVDDGTARRWWVLTERDRPDAQPVDGTLVAIPCDAAGMPTALPPDAPSVFCFLPTRDRPGLRVMVHARFPLPVDRERVDVHAPQTEAALRRAGRLICARALQMADPAPLLRLLPLPGEVQPPIWASVRLGFAEAASGQPLLPTPGGQRVAASAARLAPAALAQALAGIELVPGASLFAISAADARTAAVLRAIGVEALRPGDLFRLIDTHGAAAPPWLAAAAAEILALIANAPDLSSWARRRPDEPLAPDEAGVWRSAGTLARCPTRLRAFFAHRPLVAPTLDSDPRLEPIWRAYGLPRLDDDAAAEALRDAEHGPVLCAALGPRVLDWMADQPLRRLEGLQHLPVVPDDRGALRPIVGGAALPGSGPLTRWARRWPDARPPLVDNDIAAAHGALLASLGASIFGVDQLLDGALSDMGADPRDALHGALHAIADELSPRQLDRLARARLFVDVHGDPRALRGPGPALMPENTDLESLLPASPWLAPGLRRARHVALIGPTVVGATAVVQGVVDPSAPLAAPVDSPRWHQLVEWIIRHRPAVDHELRLKAAAAPIWASADGYHRFDALRTPPKNAAWADLYRLWQHWPAPTAAAESLAEALAVPGAGPTAPQAMVGDFVERSAAADGWLDAPIVGDALAAVGRALDRDALVPLAMAPLHPDESGLRWPLAGFGAGEGIQPAEARWRPVLRRGPTGLLDAGWQAAIEPLLGALGCPFAGLTAALDLAEAEPEALAPAEAWWPALVDSPPWSEASRARLSALLIWPTREGQRAPANAVCPPSRLRALPASLALGLGHTLHLADEAIEAAEALADRLDFATPAAALVAAVTDAAVPGAPLTEQPPWLGTVEAVRTARRIIRDGGGETDALPLRVDLAGRLTSGPLFTADADARCLAHALPIADRVAHPDDGDTDPPLPARRLLAGLADMGREPGPIEAHPILAEATQRQALYRWLVAVADEIDADDQARGQLGRAALWPTDGGTLRRPRDLMPIDEPLGALGVADDGLDWYPAAEIPRLIIGLLRRWFLLDARSLRTAVEHVVAAHRAIGSDVDASARLIGVLARLLASCTSAETPLTELVARFKLHRQIKVADAAGHFDRARALFVPLDREQGQRVQVFLADPPPRPHPAYGADVEPVLRAAGAIVDLDDAALERGLSTPRPGLEAALARVAYIAQRAADDLALIERLDLHTRPWLLDRQDQPCRPAALDWPDADLDALIGPDGGRRPHPAVVHAMPERLLARLAVRTADDADPLDVARRLIDGRPITAPALRWFDAALHDKRISPEQARDALAGRVVFADDDGLCRPPEALVRDLPHPGLGRRRGGFVEGRRVPRLMGALGVPAEIDDAVREAWLHEIATDARRRRDLLTAEPELRTLLPSVVGALAVAGPAAPAIILADVAGRQRLHPGRDDRLTWPWPAELVPGAGRTPLPIAMLEGPDAAIAASAARWGMPTLADRWTPAPASPPDGHPQDEMTETLAELWRRLPRVLGRPVADGEAPRAIRIDDASEPGRIEGVDVPWPRRARIADDLLLLDPDAEPAHIARALWRDRLIQPTESDDDPRVERIARLIACRHGAAMDLLLDAEGAPPDRAQPALQPKPTARPVRARDDAPDLRSDAPSEPPTSAADDRPDEPLDSDGLLDRFKRWWRGDEDSTPPTADPAPERDPKPERPRPEPSRPAPRPAARNRPDPEDRGFSTPDTTLFFRPQRAVESQLRANPGWLATRQTPTDIGFAFAPGRLAGVHQYGPALIVDRFDPRSRRWTPAAVDPAWSRPPEGAGFRVAFTGRLPTGEAALPIPFYGRVAAVEAEGVRRLQSRDGRPIVVADRPVDVRYTVELAAAPRYLDTEPIQIDGLLAPTVPDDELPAECHDLVGGLLDVPPRARVAGIGQFVRRHYRYDPRYLEDAEHARWLRRMTRGRANTHIAALHAGRDGRHLGAGVCYELNALVCELARRAGIPSAIATGWTFDRGWIDQPDHLWAMALLATEDGPRWLPVDASTTTEGRPLHAAPRPPGPHRAEALRQHRPPPRPVAWTDVAAPESRTAAPLRELLRVIRHAEQLGDLPQRDEAARLEAARRLLTEPARARALISVVEADRETEG